MKIERELKPSPLAGILLGIVVSLPIWVTLMYIAYVFAH